MYDITLNVCGKDLDNISNELELEINTEIQQPKDNEMVAHASKFQLIFLQKNKLIEKTCHVF